MCYYVYLYKQFFNINVREQTFTRFRQLNNFNKIIYVYDYYIAKTIYFLQIFQKMKQCIFEAAIYLNENIINFNNALNINF